MPALKNAKRETFCLEYVKDFNGARSARAAGYTKNRSQQAAHELLTFPDVHDRIEELKQARWQALQMGPDEVLARMARVARFDPRSLFDADGNMKPPKDWDDDTAGAVSGMDVEELKGNTDDKDPTFLQVRKVKSTDRMKALDLLAKHHGLFEKDNEQQSAGARRLADMLEEVAASGGHKALVKKR